MTVFRLSDEVCAIFPDARIALIAADGVRPDRPWPEADSGLADLEQRCEAGQWSPAGEDDDRIAQWHEAYRGFGVNPRRVRPSVDALGRRLARSGRLPRISGAVDAYNLISVTYGMPAGAFDLRSVEGDVLIRFGREGDVFSPLGEPETVESPGRAEVVYADDRSVLTRCWNHRDADRTKVTASSREVVFILETLNAERYGQALADAATRLAGFVTAHSSSARCLFLDQSVREARMPQPVSGVALRRAT
jgi:DNA/RNA-binding domain of Phe-tRNA-synthetase-like protein